MLSAVKNFAAVTTLITLDSLSVTFNRMTEQKTATAQTNTASVLLAGWLAGASHKCG